MTSPPPRDGDLLHLLKEVLAKRAPILLAMLEEAGLARMDRAWRRTVQEHLGDELIATGLDAHDEPTARGRAIEDLIDRVGR